MKVLLINVMNNIVSCLCHYDNFLIRLIFVYYLLIDIMNIWSDDNMKSYIWSNVINIDFRYILYIYYTEWEKTKKWWKRIKRIKTSLSILFLDYSRKISVLLKNTIVIIKSFSIVINILCQDETYEYNEGSGDNMIIDTPISFSSM